MNTRPSIAEEWFTRLKNEANQAAYLKSLVNSTPPTFEAEWIDFKGAERIEDKKIKEIWSEALSGFANTAGGVLVWGLDARKDKTTGVDCVQGLSLVPDAARLNSRLKELHHDSNDPPVQGVEFLVCSDPADGGKGFVVCYIPESSHKPHRAEHCGKTFSIRVGDSFVQPNVSILRSMFYPQVSPWLEMEIKATKTSHFDVQLEGYVTNSGAITASNLLIVVQSDIQIDGVSGWKLTNSAFGRNSYCLMRLNQPFLHSGQVSRVFAARKVGAEPAGATFKCLMFAEDAQPMCTEIRFSDDDLDDSEHKVGKTEPYKALQSVRKCDA